MREILRFLDETCEMNEHQKRVEGDSGRAENAANEMTDFMYATIRIILPRASASMESVS